MYKNKILILIIIGFFVGGLLFLSGCKKKEVPPAKEEKPAVAEAPTGPPKNLCEYAMNVAQSTADIVKGLHEKLKTVTLTNEFQKDEMKDGEMWLSKADEIFQKTKASYEQKGCDKQIETDFNQAWQWYIKAGTNFVTLDMMLKKAVAVGK